MYALLTLPRGVPIDPEAPALASGGGEAPVGTILRPGPAPSAARVPLRHTLARARS